MNYLRNTAWAAFGALLSANTARAQGVKVYLGVPRDQTSPFTSTTTETFNSLAAGNRTTGYAGAIGTYALSSGAPFNIQADNQYGNGTGNYMSFGAQSATSAPITLNLTGAQQYFGFAWCAGDSNNGVTFYRGSTQLFRFSTATLTSLLAGSTVTAVNGSTYNTSQYKGKPAAGTQNTGEPYSFVHFVGYGGLDFDRIVFDNSATTSTGFETDNHTISAIAPTVIPNGFVLATTVAVAIPEPGSLALLALALPFFRQRRRRRKQPKSG